ncbi:hypothetical protein I316_03724 [Kwoniella heveanensis BCC8398]|uniref:Anaphase-promoting complex subunit 5 n=1 Tax=Kwoniella heveanensis BCC8398 TaxID=1296120 RepID=A0A1B9GUF0_9TREE|nr:hypothetical protein I316_03724 [Kwoniella heveanensis BCC8398]
MSSPRKRSRTQFHQGRKLSEPSLPLHIALAWIIERIFPLNNDCQPVPVYSHRFVSDILRIIVREILEVGSRPATFTSLRDEIDPLVRTETNEILKRNNKKRSRGQAVQEEYEDAEVYTSWMTTFGEKFHDAAEGCAFLDRLEKELRDRLNYADDDDPTEFPEPIERHSPLGIFSRNLLNTLRKLSFDETAHLSREISKWCGVGPSGACDSNRIGVWSLDRRSGIDDTLDKRIKAMQDYQAANASGDYSNALASLRRFYDYQFPSAGRGQHQHALLNIASFHYSTGGIDSAQSAVDEAIRVARTAGDKACLQHCLSLSQRIQTESSASAFTASETVRIHRKPISKSRLPEGTTPMDQLWSVKPALDLGEPVPIAFRRIHTALGTGIQVETPLGDEEKSVPKQFRTGQKLDIAAWHATQAGLWGQLGKLFEQGAGLPSDILTNGNTISGSSALAAFHEDLTLEDLSPWDDGRLTVTLSRAQRAAERAEYDEALSLLLEMSTIQGISLAAYHRWARVVWAVLERRAKLHDDSDTVAYLVSLQPPKNYSKRVGPGGPTRETGHPASIGISMPYSTSDEGDVDMAEVQTSGRSGIKSIQEEIRESLRKGMKLHESNAPSHMILPHVLSSVQLSSELGLWGIYRFGMIVLAEALLEMDGMAEKALNQVEQVWDQVLAGDDLEAIARGALVLGKASMELALIAEENGGVQREEGSVRTDYKDRALRFIMQALEAATKLESRFIILECTSLLSLIHQLGEKIEPHSVSTSLSQACDTDVKGRGYIERYMATKAGLENMGENAGLARKVGEIVKFVGVRVAQGWK